MFLAFIIANIVIILGYALMSFSVASFNQETLGAKRKWFVAGAVSFFLLCAATHVDLLMHALDNEGLGREDWTSWHMFLIHVPQAVSLMVAVWGLWSIQRWLRAIVEQNKELRKFIASKHLVRTDLLED